MNRRTPAGVVLLAGLLLLLLPPASPAQVRAPASTVELVGLTGVVGPGSRPAETEVPDEDFPDDVEVRMAVTVDDEYDDVRVTAELHPAVLGRGDLHRALDEGTLDTRAITSATLPIEDPPAPGDTVGLALTLAGSDIPWPDEPGVFPLAVTLFDGSTLLDTMITAVVWLPRDVVPTLQAVAVIPLWSELTLGPQGRPTADPLPATAPDGRLRTLLRILLDRPDLVVAPSPDLPLLEELVDRADGWATSDGIVVRGDDPRALAAAATLDELRSVLTAARPDPILGPYADADIAALAAATSSPSVVNLAVEAVTTAQTRLQAMVGRAPDLGTFLATTTTTPAAVDVLRDQRIILPYGQTQGPPADVEPDLPAALSFLGSDGGREVPALVTDPHVDAILQDTDVAGGVVGRRQRLQAELASLWLQAPDTQRVLVVLPPEDWDPSPRLAAAWFDLLDTTPWLTLTSARDATVVAGPPSTVPQLFASSTSRMPSNVQAQLTRSLQLLAALEAASGDLEETDTRLVLPRLRDAILRATADVVDDPAAASELLSEVQEVIESGFGSLSIAAPNTTLDGDGELPVTMSRTGGGDINVVVRVESAGRLQWEEQGQRQNVLLPAGGTRTVSFQTRAVSRGTFPVTVTVLDPTETRVLATTDLSVRNTALNTVVLAVIAVLVLGLLIAGRRRRAPGLELVGFNGRDDS